MQRAKKDRKRYNATSRRKVIRSGPQPNELNGASSPELIKHNESPPDSLTKLLENLSIFDLIGSSEGKKGWSGGLLEIAGFAELEKKEWHPPAEAVMRMVESIAANSRFAPIVRALGEIEDDFVRDGQQVCLWMVLLQARATIAEIMDPQKDKLTLIIAVPFVRTWRKNTHSLIPGSSTENPLHTLLRRIVDLFNSADPDRFRRCALESCGRLFYAKRDDQLCCWRKCNNARLQRKWYRQHRQANPPKHQWAGPKCKRGSCETSSETEAK